MFLDTKASGELETICLNQAIKKTLKWSMSITLPLVTQKIYPVTFHILNMMLLVEAFDLFSKFILHRTL